MTRFVPLLTRFLPLLLLAFLLTGVSLSAQVSDSCLRLMLPHEPTSGFYNPDSVRIDSCSGSPSYLKKFGKGMFLFNTSQTIAFLPWADEDSIVEFSWQAIDTSFPNVRTAFQQLESQYGTFYLRKIQPHDTVLNSPGNTSYKLRYATHVQLESVQASLASIPLVDYARYQNQVGMTVGGIQEADGSANMPFRVSGSDNMITVSTPNNYSKGTIVSLLGNSVLQFTFERTSANEVQANINISSLPNGIYFVVCGGRSVAFVKGGW